MQSLDKKQYLVATLCFLALFASWYWGIKGTPTDRDMGDVYRIIYLHVPSAFTAFFSSFIIFVFSVLSLWRKEEKYMLFGKACAEVGLIFTVLTLATGSIWGRPTWGTWWTWDARLTTTLLLGILYAGYLTLHATLMKGPQRQQVCAVLGILIFANVPIIYKSVTWWRTLHQPPSLLREGGSTMSPEILSALLIAIGTMLLVGTWLFWQRATNLRLAEEIEQLSYDQLHKQPRTNSP